MKKKCAKEALNMIKDGMVLGLGGGSTVGLLINEIVVAVTPSSDTEALCIANGIPLCSMESVEHVDIAFDGCDEADQDLNALKACGGIHTREKILATLADDYFLLLDESKLSERLQFNYPVTVEVVKSARSLAMKCLKEMGASVTIRKSKEKAGYTVADDGGYLMEAVFEAEKVADPSALKELNEKLNAIPGMIGHGLFYQVATGAIVVGKDEIKVLKR